MIRSHNCEYFAVSHKIQLKMKLLDTKIVDGIYLDRAKNLSSHYYNVKESEERIKY